ncbi:MAG: ATP-binding protein, partial [Pseudomonadota bacterium]
MMRINLCSLAWVLTMTMLMGLTLPALIGGGLAVKLREEYAQQEIQADLKHNTQVLSSAVGEALWKMDETTIRVIVDAVMQNPQLVRVSIRSQESLLRIDVIREDRKLGNSQILSHPVMRSDQPIGSVEVEIDDGLKKIEARRHQLVEVTILLVQMALSFVLVMLTMRYRLLSPLRRLVAFAEQIAHGNLTTTLDWHRSDEVGRLAGQLENMRNSLYRGRRVLEDLVAERTQSLSQALDFNRTILLNSPLPMVVYAATGQCVLGNEAYARLVGATCEALLAQNFREIAAWRVSGLLDDGLAALADHHPRRREVNVVTSFGKAVWVECQILPTRLNDEDHLLVQFVDLTERELSEQKLRDVMVAANAANRAKSVFLSNMSHELRTPMNAILGFARLLERDSGMSDKSRQRLATINRSGQHLLALINDVLEISRIEAGRVEIKPAAFDLGELLKELADMIHIRAEEKGLAFTLERDPGLPSQVLGDAHRLKQILINLLGNAVKYTDRGQVNLGVKGCNGRICFEVTDTGPGITQDEQVKLFQPFYQTESGIAKGEGTGLGLAISREYARLMGGELGMESQPGRGSVFRLSLPLPSTDTPALKQVVHQGRVVGLEAPAGQLRILVVDDKPDNRELVCQLLGLVGFEVETAENGQQAIDRYLTGQPRLICMDMRMPVMDGYEATRRIRELPGDRDVKIVALTASAFEEDHAGILAAGCDEVVKKPVEEDPLFGVMGKLLGLRYRYADETAPAAPPPAAEIDLSGL